MRGPDVLILDSMNIDTYADKGVLMDLSDIISEVDKTDGLYMNLIDPFYRDDKFICGSIRISDSINWRT